MAPRKQQPDGGKRVRAVGGVEATFPHGTFGSVSAGVTSTGCGEVSVRPSDSVALRDVTDMALVMTMASNAGMQGGLSASLSVTRPGLSSPS